ncbi:hypothetical protein GCM10028856_05040 [Halopiger thermotolerans]
MEFLTEPESTPDDETGATERETSADRDPSHDRRRRRFDRGAPNRLDRRRSTAKTPQLEVGVW